MLWSVSQEDPEAAAGSLLAEEGDTDWEKMWGVGRFRERAHQAGISDEDADRISSLGGDFLRAGRAVVPWSHVFEENQHAGAETEEVLKLTLKFVTHALRALERRWPDDFSGADTLWA